MPRDAVDDAVAAAGKQARRSDGKLPPHVVVYLVMALALFSVCPELAPRQRQCADEGGKPADAGWQ